MITSVGSRIVSAGRGAANAGFAHGRAAPLRLEHRRETGDPAPRHAQSRPHDSRRCVGLEDLLCDPAALPSPARATAAARAFSAGNGYLSGLIVDRFA
jgi:hypothetical protein